MCGTNSAISEQRGPMRQPRRNTHLLLHGFLLLNGQVEALALELKLHDVRVMHQPAAMHVAPEQIGTQPKRPPNARSRLVAHPPMLCILILPGWAVH